jgi:hypothetical protein
VRAADPVLAPADKVFMSRILAVLFLLGGAAGFSQEGKPAEAAKAQAAASSEEGSPAGPVVKTYVIGPEDMLFVRVWREPELSGQFPVRPDWKSPCRW